MLNDLIQFYIVITTTAAITLLTSENPLRARLGGAIGLLGQPAWFWSTDIDAQWGHTMVFIAFTYTYTKAAFPQLLPFLLKGLGK